MRAVELLDLQPNDLVLDFFCGTGINFPVILPQLGAGGRIVGIDGSAGMLRKAEDRIRRTSVGPTAITLVQQDFLQLEDDFLRSLVQGGTPPKVLITLGLSILPQWRTFFECLYTAMPTGTRFCIMDVYKNPPRISGTVINWIGSSDCTRRVWGPLEEAAANYHQEAHHPFRLLNLEVVLAAGRKP